MIDRKTAFISIATAIAAAGSSCESDSKPKQLEPTVKAEGTSQEIKDGMTVDKFRSSVDELMDTAIEREIGTYPFTFSFEGIESESLSIHFIIEGEPEFVSLARGDEICAGDDLSRTIQFSNYLHSNDRIVNMDEGGVPYWKLHPELKGLPLTPIERKAVIDEAKDKLKLAEKYEPFDEIKTEEEITIDEYNQQFDKLFLQAHESGIGIPFTEGENGEPENGVDINYVDQSSALLIKLTLEKGHRHFKEDGLYKSVEDSTARTVLVDYRAINLMSPGATSFGNNPPTQFYGPLSSSTVFHSEPDFPDPELTANERAKIIKRIEIALENPVSFDPDSDRLSWPMEDYKPCPADHSFDLTSR